MTNRALVLLLAFLWSVPACAQLTSLSPDLIVNCSGGSCTIKSSTPVVSNPALSMPLDSTTVGLTLWRTCPATVCPGGMSDPLIDPLVMGVGNSVSICTRFARDVVKATTPVINGRTSISIAAGQCAAFVSTGSTYLAVLWWQSNPTQICPAGTHMISGTPFRCN